MIKVWFSEPGEFLEELGARPPDVEPVVRITGLITSTAHYPLSHLSIRATYLRADGGAPRVVELRRYVGQVFAGDGEPGDPHGVRAAANKLRDELVAGVERLGLTAAAGVYQQGAEDAG